MSEIVFNGSPGAEEWTTKNDLFREIALVKLLMHEENDSSSALLKKTFQLQKSLAHKVFSYLNSKEIWSLMCAKTRCGNTFYRCLSQAQERNETVFGFQPLDAECYTKFRGFLWPCLMDYFQVDLHTLPSIARVNDAKKWPMNFTHPTIQLFSLVIIRNLNNYSFQTSSDETELALIINKLMENIIAQCQGQYVTIEQFTEKHFQRFTASLSRTSTNQQYPRGLYMSADESLFIWVMGADHLRVVVSSTTLNISSMSQTLNNYCMLIDKNLRENNHSFAFHSKFGYLTSSIEELSGFRINIHYQILNDRHQRLVENQLYKVREHLCYSTDSTLLILTNRPALGLTDHEKLLRTIYATLSVLQNSLM